MYKSLCPVESYLAHHSRTRYLFAGKPYEFHWFAAVVGGRIASRRYFSGHSLNATMVTTTCNGSHEHRPVVRDCSDGNEMVICPLSPRSSSLTTNVVMFAPMGLLSKKEIFDPQILWENCGDCLFTAVTLIVMIARVENRGHRAAAGRHDEPSSLAVTVTEYCDADDA